MARPWKLWEDGILGGYPAFADIQFLTWYPLRLLAFDFNVFIISAYVLASLGACGLVLRLTRSPAAGLVAGLIYGMGGFMMAHLGHPTIIHAALWAPLLLWAIDALAERPGAGWTVAGAVIVACALLAGHPQIFCYQLVMAGAFAAFHVLRSLRSGPWPAARLAGTYLFMVALGLGLAAVQILPLIEIGGLSQREAWSFDDFVSYRLPPQQWGMVLFPYLFGGLPEFHPPYFGRWNLTELTCFAGMTSLFLALVAQTAKPARPQVLFWTAVAAVGLAYCFGQATPLAEWAYRVPVLGRFRAPSRGGFIFILAVAVLAGYGVSALRQGRVGGRALAVVTALFAAGLATALTVIHHGYPALQDLSDCRILPPLTANPAILVPLGAGVAGVLAGLFVARHRGVVPVAVLLAVLVLDLGSFAWTYEWRLADAAPAGLGDPAWDRVRSSLAAEGGRLLPLQGAAPPLDAGTPNLSLISGMASASGYGPLLLTRYSEATGIQNTGNVTGLVPDSPLLKLLDIGWAVVEPPVAKKGIACAKPKPFHDEGALPVRLMLGHCGLINYDGPLHIALPKPVRASHLHVVSDLACSPGIVQDDPTLEIAPTLAAEQTVPPAVLAAGRDTAEWALDHPDVAPFLHQGWPNIASVEKVGEYNAYRFAADLPLAADGAARTVTALSLRWLAPSGMIEVEKIDLVDESSGRRTPVPLVPLALDDRQAWDEPLPLAHGGLVAHYRRGLGRAWLVPAVRRAAPETVVQALRSGRLPGGTAFDPAAMALLEDEPPPAGTADAVAARTAEAGEGAVRMTVRTPTRWVMEVETPKPAFLVVSQTHYPGWRAFLNDRKTYLYLTDHAFQGVAVPAGHSRVELRFRPRSLIVGAGISGASALLALGLLAWNSQRRKRRTGAFR